MKKVYVAARFNERETVINMYDQLKLMGFEISYDWTVHQRVDPDTGNINLAGGYSEIELNEILKSDIFIFLSNKDGTTSKMEVGAAIMANKLKGKPEKIYVVGKFSHVSPLFFYDCVTRVNSLKELRSELERLEK